MLGSCSYGGRIMIGTKACRYRNVFLTCRLIVEATADIVEGRARCVQRRSYQREEGELMIQSPSRWTRVRTRWVGTERRSRPQPCLTGLSGTSAFSATARIRGQVSETRASNKTSTVDRQSTQDWTEEANACSRAFDRPHKTSASSPARTCVSAVCMSWYQCGLAECERQAGERSLSPSAKS